MNRALTAFLAALALASAALALASAALAQSPPFPPSLPAQTYVGNPGLQPAPGQAVPLAVLRASILYGETQVSDTNYAVVAADRTIAYTAITAARTVTLLSASSYPPGTQLFLLDRSGSASSTKTISVAPTGADLINGVNAATVAVSSPYVIVTLETDGVSKWTASAALSSTIAPFFAPTNPSSGNFIGSGNPTAHQLVWSDTNPQFNADVMQFFSSDPSAVATLTLGGTPVTGDLYTLNFVYNSGTVSVFYTVQSGDTLAKVAAQLTCAVANNATLFNLNSATCNTATGVITPAANASYGGYGNAALVGYVVPVGTTQFAFDYNSAIALQMSYTVSGSHTETVTFPSGFYRGPQFAGGTSGGSANAQTVAATGFTRGTGTSFTFTAGNSNSGSTTINVQSTGVVTVKKNVLGALVNLAGGEIVSGTSYTAVDNGTNYVLNLNSATVAGGSTQSTNYQLPNALDNNPARVDGRIAGTTPPAASVIANWAATGATSACASTRCATYGQISHYVGNSVAGNLQSAWIISGEGGNGSFQNGGGGVWVGQGIYGNSGGSPFNGGLTDEGPGTANFNTYWIANAYTLSQVSSNPVLNTASAGFGINTTPTNGEFNSSLGAFFSGSQVPSSGTGVSIAYNSGGTVISENFGSSTYELLSLEGSQIQILPSGTLGNGILVQTHAVIPGADDVTQLGSSIDRWTNVHSLDLTLYGATSGNIQVSATATAGTNTITLPAVTATALTTSNAGGTISSVTNSLGSDVNLNASTYTDGPVVAQGTSGTWFVSGTVTITDTGAIPNTKCKLWDNTTVIASSQVGGYGAANVLETLTLSGVLASPAASIRISCIDNSGTTGVLKFNTSGNSKDSTLTAIRIN